MWRISPSVSTKLAAVLLASTAAALLWLGYANQGVLRRNLEDTAILSAQRMADVIYRSTHHGMLANNREDIIQTIQSIGSQPGVKKVRIFDKKGTVQYSTLGEEIGHTVDQRAEACVACHASRVPLEKPESKQTARIYRAGQERLIGLIRPIENQPACSNAGCHAHAPNVRVLGVLDVVLSLEAVDQALASHERRMQAQVILSAAVLMGVAIVAIWLLISRPIRRLIEGVNRFGTRELSFRFHLRRRDELGQLAGAFDNMAGELESVNRTLEQRIERKTRALESAQEKLVHSEKLASLGELAAAVAHELNNPLAGIYTYGRLLAKKLALGEPESGWLETIQNESRRCGEIVNNLLVFARHQATEMAPADVRLIVERTLAVVRHRLEMGSIGVVVDVPDLGPVTCDASQIQQVLLAIVMNAADALCSNGGGERRLRIGARRVENQWLEVAVTNNGPPIPAEAMTRLFEPFFTTKQASSGAGLGLAVAYGIVKRHGGEILVETGAETTFRVRLPLPAEPALYPPMEIGDARGEVLHPHRG